MPAVAEKPARARTADRTTRKLIKPADARGRGQARRVAELFKTLSDPTRLELIRLMADAGEVHVGALCAAVGQSQPAVSHHLCLLKLSGLIGGRRAGKRIYYSVKADAFAPVAAELATLTA